MNNQAAQTMPELKPCPFCGGEAERIDFGPGDAENAGGSCIACKRCQSSGPVEFGYKENFISNWNRRAAALSQPAGVAEPNGKLVGWWNGIKPDVTELSPYGPSVRWGAGAEDSAHDIPLYDGYNPVHFTKPTIPSVEAFASAVWCDWMTNEQADKLGAELHAWLRAHIAAAPAASGGESTSAASVSERARDMVTALYGDKAVFTRHDVARAIEQALTQQRGEPVFDRAWVVRDAELRAAAYNLLNLVEGVGCERWQNANGFRLKDTQQWVEFYTATKNVQSFGEVATPQSSADAVREDSARLDWIESQIREYGDGYTEPREAGWGIQWQQERPDHYWPGLRAWIDEERRRASGDELESLLSAASGEGVGHG